MILEKLVFISTTIFLIVLLTYKFIKKGQKNNVIFISILCISLGSYLPFVIYRVSIPKILQIVFYFCGLVLPAVYTILQYNDINILKKLLYYNLKNAYKNKNYVRTMELLKKVIYFDGYTSEYAVMFGNCYRDQNDFIKAQEFYESAISLDKYNPNAYCELASIYEKFDDKKEAIKLYTRALQIKPDYYEAYEALGILLTRQGRFACAVDIYNRAILMFPNSFEMLYNLAMIESELGNYESAISSFEKAINAKPDLYSAYYSLGNLYYNKKEYEKSIEAYKKILNTTVYGTRAYYNISIVYAASGDYDRAMSSLEYAMELDPHYIKEADMEYAFNPIREMINNYKIQKEKNNIKDYSKRNFNDKGFRLLDLNNSENISYIENKKENEEKIEDKEKLEEIIEIQNHA